MKIAFTAGPDDDDRRLESILRRLLPDQPLSALQKALRTGDIRVNGAKAGPDTRVKAGDTLTVWDKLVAPPPSPGSPGEPRLTRELPPGWVVFEGPDLVVINKPSGLLVHRGEGRPDGPLPLDDRVRAWLSAGSRPNLGFRPGPLHRLDKETSGLVVFSRTLVGARSFSAALAQRQVEKRYLAVLAGRLGQPADLDLALARDGATRTTAPDPGGDAATTRFVPLGWADGLTLAEVSLGTGRTHQIRAHAQALGHPLAGDRKYGGPRAPGEWSVPWFLHAWRLSSPLLPPLEAPLSEEMARWLKKTFKFFAGPTDLVK